MGAKSALLLWVSAIAVCVASIAYRTESGGAFDSDFLRLLPPSGGDAVRRAAEQRLSRAMERETIWMVGADSATAATEGADQLAQRIEASGLFEGPTAAPESTHRIEDLYNYRFQLLNPDTAQSIRSDADAFIAQSFAELFSPFGAPRLASLASDPLGLFAAAMGGLLPVRMSPIADDRAAVTEGERHWIALPRTLAAAAFDLSALERLQRLVVTAKVSAPAGAEILVSGLPLFTADGASRARSEISTVGVGSLLLVLLLLVSVFRSSIPVLFAVVSIGSGLCLALAVSMLVFDRLHLMSLVFGATLVGVSIDYALHYLCDSLRSPSWDPKRAIARIMPGISLSLVTTLLAYASMALSPLPALRQIAVFSVTGLCGAWLVVALLLPALGQRWPFRRPDRFVAVAQLPGSMIAVGSDRALAIGSAIAAVTLGLLVSTVVVDDDVRKMQSPDARLLRDAERISELIGVGRDTQFLLVHGADVEETLARELRATGLLDVAVHANRLKSYGAISAHFPSPATQAANYALLDRSIYASDASANEHSSRLRTMLERIGAREDVLERHMAEFRAAAGLELSVDTWLGAVGPPWRDLWLGCSATSCASLVTMSGYGSLTATEIANLGDLAGVEVVDRAREVTDLLGAFRITATQLLAVGCIVIAAVVGLRFGAMGAVRVTCVPLGAVLVTLLITSLLGIPASLFTVFGLMLVIGLGFDYGIFNYLYGREPFTSLAILLSSLTTLAAFGLLALSGTAVVSQFGLTLGVGITAAYLLGPLAARSVRTEQ